MKKLVKVYACCDGNPDYSKRTPEISCINDDNPQNWVEVCWGVSKDEEKKVNLGDEYVVILRKPRWYDKFI